MKRINHTAAQRANLDKKEYRLGFILGYGSGANAAIEHAADCFDFGSSYSDHFYLPDEPLFRVDEELPPRSEQEKLSYEIGYRDAYDLGFNTTLRNLEEELRNRIP
jgi:hypothetical protein